MKLIYKIGALQEKFSKIRKIDNLRDCVEEKTKEGEVFSYESIAALAVFPESHCITDFRIQNDKIEKGIFKIKNPLAINWGYVDVRFHESRYYNLEEYEGEDLIKKTAEQEEKKEWICCYLRKTELEKIGWTNPNEIPYFVIEVFTKLDCMPDEIIE